MGPVTPLAAAAVCTRCSKLSSDVLNYSPWHFVRLTFPIAAAAAAVAIAVDVAAQYCTLHYYTMPRPIVRYAIGALRRLYSGV